MQFAGPPDQPDFCLAVSQRERSFEWTLATEVWLLTRTRLFLGWMPNVREYKLYFPYFMHQW